MKYIWCFACYLLIGKNLIPYDWWYYSPSKIVAAVVVVDSVGVIVVEGFGRGGIGVVVVNLVVFVPVIGGRVGKEVGVIVSVVWVVVPVLEVVDSVDVVLVVVVVVGLGGGGRHPSVKRPIQTIQLF